MLCLFVCLFAASVLAVEEKWRLHTSCVSSLFQTCLLWPFTTHMNIRYVLWPSLTVPMYIMLSKTAEHTTPCCYCTLHPYKVSYSFLGLGSIAQENTAADILIEDRLRPQLTGSENSTNQIAETKWSHSSWYKLSTEVVSTIITNFGSFGIVVASLD